MRICMVTDTFWPRINGVCTSVAALTRALRALGHEVYIAALDYDDLPTRKGFVEGDCTPLEGVIRFPAHPVLLFPEDPMVRFLSRAYAQRQAQIRALDVDVVHIHTPLTLGISALYWHRPARVPLVHTYHTLFEDFLPHYFPVCYLPPAIGRGFAHWFSLNIFHWYCGCFDSVIAPSQQVADVLSSYHLRCPVDVIPTGIEVARFQGGDGARIRREWGIEADERLLLFAGRVCFEKNVPLLVRALAEIMRHAPEARLAIVGRGPAEAAIRTLSRELGIAHRVHLAGYRPHTVLAPQSTNRKYYSTPLTN